ncbi:unnamed protein product [Lactuca saligna]|uniref:Uncharacterized protein n=1 Tax=Lactuca saligna TaxID=75948 RepID=A0AA35VEY9_LACSI|nr:unnamed protein product [Lactuca saligna]
MNGRIEAEANPQKQIIVADIPDADATTDQPIPDIGDQSITDDYEGFLLLGFMKQADVPQGTDSDIESENEQLNPQKWKPTFLRRAYDAEAGSYSTAAGDLLTSPPKKKRNLIFNLNELAETWTLPIEEVNKIFNNNVEKQHIISDLNDRIERKKFGDALTRRRKPDPIIKVRCPKPKNESVKLHLVRKKVKVEYTKVVFAHELVKFGYSEWMQILEIINKKKGVHAQEVKLAILHVFNKVEKLNLVLSAAPSASSSISTSS